MSGFSAHKLLLCGDLLFSGAQGAISWAYYAFGGSHYVVLNKPDRCLVLYDDATVYRSDGYALWISSGALGHIFIDFQTGDCIATFQGIEDASNEYIKQSLYYGYGASLSSAVRTRIAALKLPLFDTIAEGNHAPNNPNVHIVCADICSLSPNGLFATLIFDSVLKRVYPYPVHSRFEAELMFNRLFSGDRYSSFSVRIVSHILIVLPEIAFELCLRDLGLQDISVIQAESTGAHHYVLRCITVHGAFHTVSVVYDPVCDTISCHWSA